MMTLRLLLAYGLITLSCVAWAVLPVLPFLSFGHQQLMIWAGVVFVIAELTWWAGVLLLGPEVVDLVKRYWRVIQQCRSCNRRRAARLVLSNGAVKGARDS